MKVPISSFFRLKVDPISFGYVYVYNFPVFLDSLDKGMVVAPYRFHKPCFISVN